VLNLDVVCARWMLARGAGPQLRSLAKANAPTAEPEAAPRLILGLPESLQAGLYTFSEGQLLPFSPEATHAHHYEHYLPSSRSFLDRHPAST